MRTSALYAISVWTSARAMLLKLSNSIDDRIVVRAIGALLALANVAAPEYVAI